MTLRALKRFSVSGVRAEVVGALLPLCGLLVFLPYCVHADGTLYLVPMTGVHAVGDVFEVHLLANTDNTSIKAAEAELSFDPSVLQVVDVSTYESVLGSWPTPPSFSNIDGTIEFAGWAHEPYFGAEGQIISIVFKVLRNAETEVRFSSGDMLAGDTGANIISSMRSAVFSIRPREVVSRPIEAVDAENASTTVELPHTSVFQPVLTQYPDTLGVGERLIIKGAAPKNSTVSIFVQKEGDQPVRNDVTSGTDGLFTFASDEGLLSGTYRVWSEAIDEDGVRTNESAAISVVVAQAGLTASAGLLPQGSLYGFIAGFLGFGIGYLFHRQRASQAIDVR